MKKRDLGLTVVSLFSFLILDGCNGDNYHSTGQTVAPEIANPLNDSSPAQETLPPIQDSKNEVSQPTNAPFSLNSVSAKQISDLHCSAISEPMQPNVLIRSGGFIRYQAKVTAEHCDQDQLIVTCTRWNYEPEAPCNPGANYVVQNKFISKEVATFTLGSNSDHRALARGLALVGDQKDRAYEYYLQSRPDRDSRSEGQWVDSFFHRIYFDRLTISDSVSDFIIRHVYESGDLEIEIDGRAFFVANLLPYSDMFMMPASALFPVEESN